MDTVTTLDVPVSPRRNRTAGPARGVVALEVGAVRAKQAIALFTIGASTLGVIEAARLLFIGQASMLDAWLFGVMYCVQMAGVSLGFHRHLSHRAFKTSNFLRALLLIAGSMAGQGPILYWVTTHRRHHAYSDCEGDPHSPNLHGEGRWSRLKGLWHAHVPWMLAHDNSSWSYYALDLLRDRGLFFLHRTYTWWLLLGLALPAAVGGLLTQSWEGAWSGFIFGGLARMFAANQAAYCVASVCHRVGSRPFATGDYSANNWLVAVLTFGEGLQNNHHAFPSWHRHGVKWYEPDLSGWLLTLLGKLGVVWGLRSPSPNAIERARSHPAA